MRCASLGTDNANTVDIGSGSKTSRARTNTVDSEATVTPARWLSDGVNGWVSLAPAADPYSQQVVQQKRHLITAMPEPPVPVEPGMQAERISSPRPQYREVVGPDSRSGGTGGLPQWRPSSQGGHASAGLANRRPPGRAGIFGIGSMAGGGGSVPSSARTSGGPTLGGWTRTTREVDAGQGDKEPPIPIRKALGLPTKRPGSRAGSNLSGCKSKVVSALVEDVALAVLPPLGDTFQPLRPGSSFLSAEGHIKELLTWVEPRKRDSSGTISTLARLVVEANDFAQESSAYLGGRCSRTASLEVSAGIGAPPMEPGRTGQAASLLVRLVRCLPKNLPMRNMLETIAMELLDAVYVAWPTRASLDELTDEDSMPVAWHKLIPWYAKVAGYRNNSELAEQRAARAEAAATEEEVKAAPLQGLLQQERITGSMLRADLDKERELHKVAIQSLRDEEELHKRFTEQVKHALSDLADVHMRDQQSTADLRQRDRLLRESAKKNDELEHQVARLTNHLQETERSLLQCEIKLQRCEHDAKDIGKVKERLQELERQEGVFGLDFAKRLANEVLGTTLDELVEAKLAGRSSSRKEQQRQKLALDVVASTLREMPKEIKELRRKVELLTTELQKTRLLVPAYNADALEDVIDAFDDNAPIHREIFSMKDQRLFAGLGTGPDVPPYLRAEGFVKHIFLSKGELERFIDNFQSYLFNVDEAKGWKMTPESLHQELHTFMMKTLEDFPAGSLAELGYAFICGLEAHRDDPDFELFDLMLSGAVHPSIMQDQQDMLKEFQSIVWRCQGNQESSANDRSSKMQGGSLLFQGTANQVSRRVLCAVIEAVFPEKSPGRVNALRRALRETFQQLCDQGKSVDEDNCFIGDLFACSTDGHQCVLIEEVRRQHYHEVIDFTSKIARMMRDESDYTGMFQVSKLRRVLHEADEHLKQQDLDLLCAANNGEEIFGETAPYTDVLRQLRQATLLRPERLWVKAEPKDVVGKMSQGPPHVLKSSRAGSINLGRRSTQRQTLFTGSGGAPGEESNTDLRTGLAVHPKRMKGAKVVDNPWAKMNTDLYSTPEGLKGAILASAADGIAEEADAET